MLLLLASVWRHTPLLLCRSRQAACLCKQSSQFSSRWQDAVVWTRMRAWKWRQEEKTSTETWKEEEGKRTATDFFFFLLVSQQILACAHPSPVQVMPPALKPDRVGTCASVLEAILGKTASWSQDSAFQTGNSFCVDPNIRSFLTIIISINNQYREHCHSPYSWGAGTVERKLD